jgi:uncharacterized BrkB/YihY/UPF0761 family membrane protein
MTILLIITILFAALFIVVPLIERSKMRVSDEDAGKIARWVWPLMIILLLIQLVMLMIR